MKKAKVILSALVVLACIGGIVAFKAKRTVNERLAITLGVTQYTFTTAPNGPVYVTTVIACVRLDVWATNIGVATPTYSISNIPSTVTGFFGTQSTTTTYPICVATTTKTTLIEP